MEDVEEELDALEAVYFDECQVKERFPPVMEIFLKPYTADDETQQFVEATLVISASPQYPVTCPNLELRRTKGLDDTRQKDIIRQLRTLAETISPEPMLVSICQEAKDLLTAMNLPSGDCSFCQMPVVLSDESGSEMPFMKLMSCFHCFHSHCFGRWWCWQMQQPREAKAHEIEPYSTSDRQPEDHPEEDEPTECGLGGAVMAALEIQCPVCRVPITSYDVAHVREYLVDDNRFATVATDVQGHAPPPDLMTPEEAERRERYSQLFESQRMRGGIIEPRKVEVITEGLMLPPPPPLPSPSPGSSPDVEEKAGTPSPTAPLTPESSSREGAFKSGLDCGARTSQGAGGPKRVNGSSFSGRGKPGDFRGRGRGRGHRGGHSPDGEAENGKESRDDGGDYCGWEGAVAGDFVVRGRRGRGSGSGGRARGRGRRGRGEGGSVARFGERSGLGS